MTTNLVDSYHVPVLLTESVNGLNIRRDGIYVDVTFGGGGHSREILRRLGGEARLLAFDQDADAEQRITNGQWTESVNDAEWRRRTQKHFTFVRSNFRFLSNWMRYHGIEAIDGLLADLGVSSHHFDDESRGFSFRFDAPLDMRMNKRAGMTAADIINNYPEERLADILYLYGEIRNARKLAAAIAKARAEKPIGTTADLLGVTEKFMQPQRTKKETAKLFQALRIEVNHEMDALRDMLISATGLLRSGGRLAVITYHSLEDRLVKNIMKTGNPGGKAEQDFFGRAITPFRLINNKVIVPNDDEQRENPRSRSAKLRIAEKI